MYLNNEVILAHCNIVNNDSRFKSIIYVCSPTNHFFLKTFNSEYDETKVWFRDQNSQPLEIEDRINLTMAIK